MCYRTTSLKGSGDRGKGIGQKMWYHRKEFEETTSASFNHLQKKRKVQLQDEAAWYCNVLPNLQAPDIPQLSDPWAIEIPTKVIIAASKIHVVAYRTDYPLFCCLHNKQGYSISDHHHSALWTAV